MVTVRVDEIRGDRERLRRPREVGDLAQSMAEVGQQQPIVVAREADGSYGLVFGWHRWQAARMLGWEEIEAEVREYPSRRHQRLAEIDENLVRHELTAMERIEHVNERAKILEELGARRGPGRPRKNAPGSGGFSTAEIGKAAGIGPSTVRWYRQIQAGIPAPVWESMRGSRFEDNLTELDRIARMERREQAMLMIQVEHEKAGANPQPGGTRELQREMQRAQTRRLGKETPEPNGRYRTILIDPPWSPEISGDVNPMGKLAPAYETWDISRIAAIDVPSLAWPDDCHLYLWVTNATLKFGLELVRHWGFEFQQKLVWRKPRMGTGRYFRHQHEDVLFATRGARLLGRTDVPDVFDGPRGRHSEKPALFYEIVEACSPGPRLELFARSQRDGWTSWGAEVPREARERLPKPPQGASSSAKREATG